MTSAGERKRVFTEAEDTYIIANRGKLTAVQLGAQLGRSDDAVKRRWRVLGVAKKRQPADPSRPPRPRKAPKVSVSGGDAALVAQFLAANDVTVCEPGTAAGLSYYERELFAAPPKNRLSYRDRHYQQVRAAMRGRT